MEDPKITQRRLAAVVTRWENLPDLFKGVVGLSVGEALRMAESAVQTSEDALVRHQKEMLAKARPQLRTIKGGRHA